jgi:hypothetical protein
MEVKPKADKVQVAVRLLQEKLTREYEVSLEELRKSTITIKNGEITVKKGKIMSLSNATETALAQYIFEGTNPSWHGATQLDLHLHKADPGEAGTSATNEADYTLHTH